VNVIAYAGWPHCCTGRDQADGRPAKKCDGIR
jgi:hypothetical protein